MKRNHILVGLALGAAAALVGCSSNSPTAPKQPTPSTYGVSLTANPNVAGINESILLVAAVTAGGGAAPDNTSVTFTTSIGVFSNGSSQALATTAGGNAAVRLFSSSGGDGTVTASVPNKASSVVVHFRGGSAAQLAVFNTMPNRVRPQGGDQVVIHGQGFLEPLGVSITVGGAIYVANVTGVAADGSTVTVITPQISRDVTLPATADVKVTTALATATLAGGLTIAADFGAPLLYTVAPAFGSPLGGDLVVLTGRYFTEPLQVDFIFPDPNPGTLNARVVSVSHGADGTDTATIQTPRVPLGVSASVKVAIRITTAVGTASSQNATYPQAFSYLGSAGAKPTIFYLSPPYGSAQGHETIVIYGQNFLPGATVSIGATPETVVSVSGDGTAITITTTPIGGVVPTAAQDVTVTNPDGSSATLAAAFTYLEAVSPTLYVLTPNMGPIEGGTRVTITGAGFQYPVQVLFGTLQAQIVSTNYSQIVCLSPSITATQPTTPTTVQVQVTNIGSGKVSQNTLPFTYGQAMFISGISPMEGPATGGTSVTITGQGFSAPVSVLWNKTMAWTVQSVAGTQVVAKSAPADNAHACDGGSGVLTVTNLASNLSATSTQAFTYQAAKPLITSVVIDGTGNTVKQYVPTNLLCNTPWTSHTLVINGSGFSTAGVSIQFGDLAPIPVPPASITASQITTFLPDLSGISIQQTQCTTGTGASGLVNVSTPVRVTVTNGNTGCFDALSSAVIIVPCDTTTCRVAAPTISAVNPNNGPITGGTAVTITGANFVTGATVTFGGVAATGVTVVGSSSITCATPAHAAGPVTVVVTNPDLQTASLANGFTYTGPPTVTAVNPNTGPIAGGTPVTITGTNFVTGATVTFGGVAATAVVWNGSTSISCTTPAHTAGLVTVVVTNPDLQTGTLPNAYTYLAPAPTVTLVNPNHGSSAGGTAVVVSGTNFVNGATVTFGGVAATGVAWVNSTTINCTTPAHAAGLVNVVVTNPDTQFGTLVGGYTYDPPPGVASVTPNTGTTAGGTPVVVSGTDFVNGATVTFGGVAATGVTWVNSTTINCTTPAGALGAVTVVVTNPDLQTGTLAAGFTYI